MSDMAAVVLSIGEPFTARAIASVQAQSEPVHEIVVIENVAPFHRALNEGARRVTAPFFVQVDSDMILDRDCTARLRALMRADTGIVVAELRDRLMGQVVGIKAFRTALFRQRGMPDSISPDTDFVDAIARAGWRTEYLGDDGRTGDDPPPRPTVGEHRPEYSPAYTYRKFFLEGRRCCYRGARNALLWRFAQLDSVARSDPSMADIADLAQVAVARGFFRARDTDGLTPDPEVVPALSVWNLLTDHPADNVVDPAMATLDRRQRLRAVFRQYLALGETMANAPRSARFRSTLRQVVSERYDMHAAVAKMGLCHGAFEDGALRSRDEAALRDFVRLGLPRNASLTRRAIGYAGIVRNRLRGRATW